MSIFSQSTCQQGRFHICSLTATNKTLQIVISDTETLMDFISDSISFPVNNNFPIITIKIFQNLPGVSQSEILLRCKHLNSSDFSNKINPNPHGYKHAF